MIDRNHEIKVLKQKIIRCLEKGENPSEYEKQLADLRAEIAQEIERSELEKIAQQRQQLRDRATGIKTAVEKQGQAIDKFLLERDKLLPVLLEIVKQSREIADLERVCWEEFPNVQHFAGTTRNIPADYLAGVDLPLLTFQNGQTGALGMGASVYRHLQAATGLLSQFQKQMFPAHSVKAEGLLGLDDEEDETPERVCLVCSDERSGEINEALKTGKSLREIETKFGVSRSTLSRHKNKCLNLGAVRVVEESPTASANATRFR